MAKYTQKNYLSLKLLISTWAVSSMATLVFTAVQIYSDFQKEYLKLTGNFEIVEKSYLQSIAEHLWSYDSRLIEIQLDGLKRISGISYLHLRDSTRDIYVAGTSHRTEQNHRTFKIYHSESKEFLGTLDVEVDIESLKMKYLEELFWIFINQAAKTLIVVFILYFIFNRLVVKHLVKISSFLSKPDIEKDEKLTIDRKNSDVPDELDVLVDSINAYRAESHEKISSLANLTSGIAHEIRNPLNFVMNFSEVLKDSVNELSKARNQEQVSQIATELASVSDAIIKHSSRIDQIVKTMQFLATTPSTAYGVVDIEQLIHESIKNIRGKYEESILKDRLQVDLDLQDIKFRAHKKQLLVAVDNILDNSFYSLKKKCERQGPDFKPIVRIRSEVTRDKIRISFWDNGSGIDISTLDKIFDPFFTTKPTGEGAGLGLTISYEVIKRHGGLLKLSDTVRNEYAHFVIEFPIESKLNLRES